MNKKVEVLFAKFSNWTSEKLGEPISFMLANLSILIWLGFGPSMKYSENWQLIVNSSTTVLTFLLLFVLQYTQNRDSKAVHAKLDEIIRALDKADDNLRGIEKDLDS